MNLCKKYEEDLSAYLDKELPSNRQKEIEEHLKICHECQKKIKELEEVWDVLDEFEAKPTSSMPIRQFYIQTLPSYLIEERKFEKHSAFLQILPYGFAVIGGMTFALLFFGFFFSDYSNFEEEIIKNKAILSNPDFEIIAHLEILENYEVWKHFTPEMLIKWKNRNQKRQEIKKNIFLGTKK